VGSASGCMRKQDTQTQFEGCVRLIEGYHLPGMSLAVSGMRGRLQAEQVNIRW